MKIITNNQPRLLIYWHDLTPTEQSEFDYLKNPEEHSFFRYRNWVYSLSDFMHIGAHNTELKGWHYYSLDSYFSGIVIRLDDEDPDYIVCGTYIS